MAHPLGSERSSVAPPPAADSARDLVQEDFLFHLYRGSELLQENRVLEAKEELEFALTVQPLDAKGQDLLGTVYFRLGLYPRAIQIYEALEPQFPRDTSIKINLALAYLKTGQAEPARRVLREAVILQPEHKRAWGYLGLALQKLGELEQAQAAFERGGHSLMARRIVEKRRQSFAPQALEPQPVVDVRVREMAETAFSELDAGDLRFSLARPVQPNPGDGPWHSVELGETVTVAPSGLSAPPPIAAEPPAPQRAEQAIPTRALPPAPPSPLANAAATRPQAPVGASSTQALPAPLALAADRRIGLTEGGALVVRTSDEPALSFACRLEAVRVVAGPSTTRVLHRRAHDADLNEVLGGIGSPMVRVAGDAQLVLGARPGHAISLLALDEGVAFVLEDRLLGFQLGLAYESGRIALEYPGERARSPSDGAPVVQLRGSGAIALEVAGSLAAVASAPGQPLLVRREWIVGWFGHLVAHALPPSEAPGGQRGLIGFSGEGTVLVGVE